MSWLGQIAAHFLSQLAYQVFTKKIKKKAVLIYLKTLQAVRKSLLATVIILITLQLMILGLVGACVTAIWLYPTDLDSKLWILLFLFSLLFLIPLIGLIIFFSESTWLRLSAAEKLLKTSD